MYFATDFAVPFEPGPGPGRFVIEDMEDAVAAPRQQTRGREMPAASKPPPQLRTRASAPARPRPALEVARRDWQTPLPRRAVVRSDQPASPDAH